MERHQLASYIWHWRVESETGLRAGFCRQRRSALVIAAPINKSHGPRLRYPSELRGGTLSCAFTPLQYLSKYQISGILFSGQGAVSHQHRNESLALSSVMSFTDDALKAKLSALNETQEGIVTVSQWVIFHRQASLYANIANSC